jgi:hypothetical protein
MDKTKRCSTCKQNKNIEEFSWRFKALGIRQGTCRDCRKIQVKKWYVEHKQEHLKNVHARKKRYRQEMRQYVWDYLLSHPCIECGESDPVVLEFHHKYGKDKAISVMVAGGYPVATIQAEIDKCDVLCANCHRRKTMKQRGWFRGIK